MVSDGSIYVQAVGGVSVGKGILVGGGVSSNSAAGPLRCSGKAAKAALSNLLFWLMSLWISLCCSIFLLLYSLALAKPSFSSSEVLSTTFCLVSWYIFSSFWILASSCLKSSGFFFFSGAHLANVLEEVYHDGWVTSKLVQVQCTGCKHRRTIIYPTGGGQCWWYFVPKDIILVLNYVFLLF